ncbi:hypothetical protein D3C71_2026830 [compost metagenome]
MVKAACGDYNSLSPISAGFAQPVLATDEEGTVRLLNGGSDLFIRLDPHIAAPGHIAVIVQGLEPVRLIVGSGERISANLQ